MTRSLTDRRRVELALPAYCLVRIADQLAAAPETDRSVLEPIGTAFARAVHEMLADLPDDRHRILRNRLRRVRIGMLREFEDRTIAVAYLAISRWIERLTAAGVIEVYEGEFVEAFSRLWDEIQTRPENEQLLVDVDRSATKAARRMHRWLRSQGYYTDFPDPFEEARHARAA